MAKVLVSIDDDLLRRIDAERAKRRVSRSAWLARVAQQELGEELGPGADPRVHAAMDSLKELFRTSPTSSDDSTDLIREQRDARTQHLIELLDE
jgi:hypothetical protein